VVCPSRTHPQWPTSSNLALLPKSI
jgi:hypothetical protein